MCQQIQRIFELQKENANDFARLNAKERIELLERIENYLKDDQKLTGLYDAMYKDFRKPEQEVFVTEIGIVQAQIDFVKKHLSKWMKPQKVSTPLPLIGTKSYICYEPKGMVLIISPWNYPFNLSLVPLVYALAAGNTAIIKPSEISSHTSTYINHMISELFNENEVAVFEGDSSVAQVLLDQPFNHIFFTGSKKVGKIVSQKSTKHLASVTLELGGKSPAIIDESIDIQKTAQHVAWSKCVNSGQTCITPDYLILHESIKDMFVEDFKDALKTFYGSCDINIQQSPDYCRIINDWHFQRLKSLYDDALNKGARVLIGGYFNESNRFVSPTLLDGISEDMDIMQEEIFGPLLPVLTYSNKSEALEIIHKRPKPLTIYISSQYRKNIDYFLEETSAGGTVINDYMLGYSNPHLPFGGVNSSGTGKSLGFHGFVEFSNQRSIIKRNWGTINAIFPPYNDRTLKLMKTLYKLYRWS
ncbi:MAG: aldehyde dehydrogenase family protein [Methanohalobium sp.]|uniref:aldehyde dehydrogenase family protein n=1 Tax=Methanohalobium sp. TaxID=2837493 RepID=UPI00397B1ABA